MGVEYVYLILFVLAIFGLSLLYQKLIKSKVHIAIKLLPLVVIALFGIFLIWEANNNSDNETIVEPIENFIERSIPREKSSQLEEIVQNELEDTTGTYAVVIKNLDTNETYYHNEERKFTSASLYKLWIMGAVFEELENRSLSKTQEIGFSAEEINERLELATESAEIKEGFVGNTVEDALEQMIIVSDNYSAHILYLTLGYNKINSFLEKYELSNSSFDIPPTTTAEDIFSFYEKLYNGEIVSESASNEIIEILKQQTWNDRIPKYLPESVEVAHKTGELERFKHDAGIVFSDSGSYIIVLLSETDNQTTAAEVEAKISEKVWEYFTNSD